MLTWIRRFFGLTAPSRREMVAQQNHLDGLEERVEYVYAELKKLRGRVYANERRSQGPEEEEEGAIENGAARAARGAENPVAGKHWYRR